MLNRILEWGACAVTLVGAGLTAYNVYPLNITFLELGAAIYIVWSIRIRKLSLIIINVTLFAIYLPGVLKSWNVISFG